MAHDKHLVRLRPSDVKRFLGVEVAKLESGRSFGAESLQKSGLRRNASIVADGACVLLTITDKDYRKAMQISDQLGKTTSFLPFFYCVSCPCFKNTKHVKNSLCLCLPALPFSKTLNTSNFFFFLAWFARRPPGETEEKMREHIGRALKHFANFELDKIDAWLRQVDFLRRYNRYVPLSLLKKIRFCSRWNYCTYCCWPLIKKALLFAPLEARLPLN